MHKYNETLFRHKKDEFLSLATPWMELKVGK